MPPGIPYIIGNEAAERFSFYGMKAILVIFMTKYLLDGDGNPDYMSDEQAKVWYHNFVSAAYFFPIIGALIADIFWGKYKTIITLSIVYCFGHLALFLMDVPGVNEVLAPKVWLALGLGLIAIGTGGIKPCVSAHVGDQFSASNKSLIERVFGWFYFSINLGAATSMALTPWLLDHVGPAVAFGIPGALMLVATWIFYLGRTRFTSVPPAGWETYKSELFSQKGVKAIVGLGIIYIFIAMFWALFDQTGSSWVLQADRMNRMVNFGFWRGELLASQIQALNPILIMLFIPMFSYVIYPVANKYVKVTPLRKIGAGFFIAGISFAICALAETWIQAGKDVSILWQALAYVIITAAEVLVSITALEFSYTQAPNSMKSFIMGLFLLSVSLGNVFVSVVNSVIQNDDGTVALAGASYFWFFVGVVLVTGVIFIFAAKAYKEELYLQEV